MAVALYHAWRLNGFFADRLEVERILDEESSTQLKVSMAS